MRAGRFPSAVRPFLRVALASAEPAPCKDVSFCMMHYSSFDPPCRPRLQVLGVTAGMLEVMLGGAVGVLGQSENECIQLFLFFLLLGYPLALLSTNFRVAGRSGSAGATCHDAKLFFPHASVSEASAAWPSVALGLVASALAASAWVALGHGLEARPRPVASGRGFGPWPGVLGFRLRLSQSIARTLDSCLGEN